MDNRTFLDLMVEAVQKLIAELQAIEAELRGQAHDSSLEPREAESVKH